VEYSVTKMRVRPSADGGIRVRDTMVGGVRLTVVLRLEGLWLRGTLWFRG
jgi:hypothetical protein